jgi:hypothetical protein
MAASELERELARERTTALAEHDESKGWPVVADTWTGDVRRGNHEVYRFALQEHPSGRIGASMRGFRMPEGFPETDTRPMAAKLSRNGKRPKARVLRSDVPPEGIKGSGQAWARTSDVCFELAEAWARIGMELAAIEAHEQEQEATA